MENKKIVEVFIETDEEEESFSSSSDESEEGGGASTTEEKMEQSHKVPGDKPTFYTGKPTSECPPVSLPGLGESLGGFETSEQASFDLYDREDSHGVAATMEVNVEDLSSESDSGSDSSSTSASPSPVRSEKSLGAFEGGSSHVKLSSGFERGETKEGFSKSELETGDRAKISMGQEQTGAHTRGDRSKTFGGTPIIDPSKLYCICQQPAQSYGMIQCHDCCDWFHGSCVGITRQKALIVKQFYCPLCIDKDPSLVTVFFEKKENKEVEKEVYQKQPRKPTGKKGVKKHSRRCGECVACLREVDCRKCRFCKDMPKYGGVGRIRQKCIKRQCLKYSRILYAEDPLHSKKRVWQQDIAAELKAVGGELADVNEATSTTSVDDSIIETSSQETASADFLHKKPEEDEAILESSKAESESVTKSVPSQQKSKSHPKKKPAKRLGRGRKQKRKGARKSFAKTTKTRLSTSDFDVPVSQTLSGRRTRKPFSNILLGGLVREETHKPQQCQGPGCVFAARPHSKYCSEDCGVQLAMNRIKTFLPEKKQLWAESEEPIATKNNREKLEQLEEEQKLIRSRLEELDRQTQAIDAHVTRLAGVTPVKEDESSEVESDDLTIHCATCSQPVPLKKAMVHLERCFSKLEGMVSFGSIVKNEGTNIFCDKYDPSQKTYCKRLRILCPEHTKEPKIGPNEVCGCPLDPQFPAGTPECKSFCQQPKRACVRHYCWEKLRRAEIDQEKLNLYLKLEEVNEQSRLHQWQIERRGSLLAVMLHHTIRHDDNKEAATGSTNNGDTCSMEVTDSTADL